MRKIIVLVAVTALCVAFALSGCDGSAQPSSESKQHHTGTPLANLASDEQKGALEGVGKQPVAAGRTAYRVDGEHESIGYGEAEVQKLRDYLNGITVGGESDMMASDADEYYVFYFEDGTQASFFFMLDQVSIDGKFYKFESSGRAPEFAGDENSLSSYPPTEELSQFVKRLQSEELVSATVEGEGAEGSEGVVVEGATLKGLAEEFEYLNLYSAMNSESFARYIDYQGLAQTTYTFTWADGSTETLRFMGEFLCVDYPNNFGTWGFYVGDLPHLA